jgi:hypothetical protein
MNPEKLEIISEWCANHGRKPRLDSIDFVENGLANWVLSYEIYIVNNSGFMDPRD